MSNLKIVIPSHKRHDRVFAKKLVNNPIICVAESQADLYRQYNPECEIVTHPDDVIEVEQEVACRGALGSHITAERCKNGGDSRTDIGAKHKRTCKVESYPALGAHDKRYGKCSG